MQNKYRVFLEVDLEKVTMLEEYTVLAESEGDAMGLILDGYGDMVGEPALLNWSGGSEEKIVSVNIEDSEPSHLRNREELDWFLV